MTYVEDGSSDTAIPILLMEDEQNSGKDRSLTYVAAFAVVGIFVSAMSLALTGAEWLPEGSITVARASAG
jgi:hypothetical protein